MITIIPASDMTAANMTLFKTSGREDALMMDNLLQYMPYKCMVQRVLMCIITHIPDLARQGSTSYLLQKLNLLDYGLPPWWITNQSDMVHRCLLMSISNMLVPHGYEVEKKADNSYLISWKRAVT